MYMYMYIIYCQYNKMIKWMMSGKRDCMYSMSCKDSERRSVIFEYFHFFPLSVASLGVVLAADL